MSSHHAWPVDAVPDITNNQVQVITLSPAQEVERLITFPVGQTPAVIRRIDKITQAPGILLSNSPR